MKFAGDYQFTSLRGNWDVRKAVQEKLEFSPLAQINFEKHCLFLKTCADTLRQLGCPEREVQRRMRLYLWYS